jgi:hypothetical protein
MASITDIVGAANNILALFASNDEQVDEPWARDEVAFENHFGASYMELVEKLPLLSSDQHARYEATLKVNPEAAVLWVLTMSIV